MKAILARIKARREEQDRLYRILDLWTEVQAQGIGPGEVDSFGFDPKLLPPTLARHRQCEIARGRDPCVERLSNGGYKVLIYNYVRLKDGGVRPLNPAVRAVF